MTFAYWCILIAALLPYVCAGLAKIPFQPTQDGYNNRDPRAWLARQTGMAARANAAQLNSFEALPFFIGAVLLAHQLHAPQARVDALACAFVVCRLAFIAAYVGDKALLRSLVWIAGTVFNIALFLSPL
jgi:uncharacterized MAPEG superfamily protein